MKASQLLSPGLRIKQHAGKSAILFKTASSIKTSAYLVIEPLNNVNNEWQYVNSKWQELSEEINRIWVLTNYLDDFT